MQVTLKDNNLGTSISINDDSLKEEGEIFIHVTADDQEAWFTIKKLKDFDDIIDAMMEFRKRLKNHLKK